MMKPANMNRFQQRRSRESGQTVTLVLLALGLFLLGAVGLAVDVSNWWFHRQMAQSAADAACTAGIMDMLVNAQEGTSFGGLPSPLADYACSSKSSSAPCKYASLNSYDGSGRLAGKASNDVYVQFPKTLPGSGLKTCSATVPPPCIPLTITNPYLVVNVIDRVPTTFTGLLSGSTTTDVAGSAACAITYSTAPIPILVLDPQNPNVKPAVSALNIQGTPTISIVGGPQRSIQVNSDDTSAAVTVGGSALIDLSHGGPASPPTGSDLGLFGAPTTSPPVPKNFNPGTTGHWIPSAPISDPFAQICAPAQTSNCLATINGFTTPAVPSAPAVPADLTASCAAIPCALAYHNATHGCPDPAGCYLYTPGKYTTELCVGSGSCTNKSYMTAVFDPGLYYLTAGMKLNPNSTVRPSIVGDGGTTFYFSGSSTITVDSNSGKSTTPDPFSTSVLPCTASSTIPSNLNGITLQGNILLGPCSGYYGDPLGTTEPTPPGEQRQFLFFQDRAGTNVNPSWGGGGQFLLAGTMYFHSCNSSGTGVNCGAAGTYWNNTFTLQGNSGSGTFVLGEIVTDNLILGGTSGITMDLNPNSTYPLLKATLIQ